MKRLLLRLSAPFMVLAYLIAVAAGAWIVFGPIPERLLDPSRFTSMSVLDRRGALLFEGLSAEGARAIWLGADELPGNALAAILAAEDRRFFLHPGVDPVAIARAAWANLRAGAIVQGGSTITQQTAKLVLAASPPAPGGRIGGKLRETVLALRLERRLSKREILALYLNLAPFGNQYVGLARASRGYFGVGPDQLTDAQAALLAALPQRPTGLDPRRHLGRAQLRQRRILDAMRRDGLSAERWSAAVAESPRVLPPSRDLVAPHVVARLQHQLRGSGATAVHTTLDARLQRKIRGILDAHRERLRDAGAHNVAVVVLDHRSEEWLAWEGSGDYFDENHGGAIDGARVPRQPGSALKPLAYAAAFDAGLGPESILPDVESAFPTAEEGVVYVPRNYDGVHRGPVTARAALAGSLNVPAVALASRIGVPRFLNVARAAGISTLGRSADYYGLGAVLGGGEVTLAELAGAYAMLARGGEPVRPRLLTGRGPSARTSSRVVSPAAAFLVADILDDDEARGPVFGRGGSLELPFPVAAKTGTSQAYRDNWAVGFSGKVTVGVWVGNFDRSELRTSSGVTGAAPIFHDVMLAAHEMAEGSESAFPTPPASLARGSICLLSGMRPTAACPRSRAEWVRAGAREACTWHRVVIASDRAGNEQRRIAVSWPPEFRAWADRNGLGGDAVAPVAVAASKAAPSIAIVHPPDGAVYLLDPTLRTSFQTVALRAAVVGRARELTWSVNGSPFASARSDRAVDLPLRPGAIRIEARDAGGHRAAVVIRVR